MAIVISKGSDTHTPCLALCGYRTLLSSNFDKASVGGMEEGGLLCGRWLFFLCSSAARSCSPKANKEHQHAAKIVRL